MKLIHFTVSPYASVQQLLLHICGNVEYFKEKPVIIYKK